MSKACWFLVFSYHHKKFNSSEELVHWSQAKNCFIYVAFSLSLSGRLLSPGLVASHFLSLHHQYKVVCVLWKAGAPLDNTRVTLVYQLSPAGSSCKKVKSCRFFLIPLLLPTQEQGWIATLSHAVVNSLWIVNWNVNQVHIWLEEICFINLQPLQECQPDSAAEHKAWPTACSPLQWCLRTWIENMKLPIVAASVQPLQV